MEIAEDSAAAGATLSMLPGSLADRLAAADHDKGGGLPMECPKCKTELPPKIEAKTENTEDERTPAPEDALRADRPPAPCPQCGWSTMWNE